MTGSEPDGLSQRVAELRALSLRLAAEIDEELATESAGRLRQSLTASVEAIQFVIEKLDPIQNPGFVFDPSRPDVAGRMVAIALVAQPRRALGDIKNFYGSGIYALYYKGTLPEYVGISGKEHPIYVGKADPRDRNAKDAKSQGPALFNRLEEHRKNILRAASTLSTTDFECRALVVQSGWQQSAEAHLIHLFRPVWNSETNIAYGIGKHGDSSKTRKNRRSPWDTLHPGRMWAHGDDEIVDAKPRAQIIDEIRRHLAAHPPFASTDEVIRTFLAEMVSPGP